MKVLTELSQLQYGKEFVLVKTGETWRKTWGRRDGKFFNAERFTENGEKWETCTIPHEALIKTDKDDLIPL